MEASTKLKKLWTRVDHETLRIVAEFMHKNKYSPTMMEIAAIRGRQVNCAAHTLRRLREQGLLEWNSTAHRQMKITEQGRRKLSSARKKASQSAGSSEPTPLP